MSDGKFLPMALVGDTGLVAPVTSNSDYIARRPRRYQFRYY